MQTFEIRDYLTNPSEDEINSCIDKIDKNFELSIIYLNSNLKLLLNNLSEYQLLRINQGIFAVLNELSDSGTDLEAVKKTYIRFLCHLKRLEKFLMDLNDSSFIEAVYYGDISKYENFILKVLSYAGCKIEILRNGPTSDVITNEWINEEDSDYFELLFKKNSVRGFLMETSGEYNLCFQYLGVDDKNEYNNRLYYFKRKLRDSQKKYIIMDEKIQNPLADEVVKVNRNDCISKENLISVFSVHFNNKSYRLAFKKLFNDVSENNINQLYNLAMKITCWAKRYIKSLFFDGENLPVFIYYGEANDYESYFLRFLSLCPVDVVYISPTKAHNYILGGRIVELDNVYEIPKFPTEEKRIKVATTAYKAEKEIEDSIYNEDTGMFKDKQFSHVTPKTLKTTYDEIFILWNEEVSVRPSFDIEGNRVYLPNIFAKVCGIKDGNKNTYVKNIKSLVKEDTILYPGFPLILNYNMISDYSLNQAVTKGKIVPDYLKRITEYNYDYINEDTQNLMIEKMQELIDLKWINYTGNNVEKIILGTLLNLDKQTLDLIQGFDYTKKNPKIIVYDSTESMPNVMDSIYLCFLNLIGFDIVIFTPTGYRNIEKFIKNGVCENYVIGDFMFNVKLPKIKGNVVTREKKGFFARLFS